MKKKPIIPMIPLFACLLIVSAVVLWLFDPLRGFGGDQIFRVSLQSSILANYGRDPRQQNALPPVSLNIIADVLRDIRDSLDPGKILRQMQTPVQTVTPFFASATLQYTGMTLTPTPPAPGVFPSVSLPSATVTPTVTLPGHHGNPSPTSTTGTPTATVVSGSPTSIPTWGGWRTHIVATSTATSTRTQTTTSTAAVPSTSIPSLTFSPSPSRTPTTTQFPATAVFTATPLTPTHTMAATGYPAPVTSTPPPTATSASTPPGYP